MKRTLKKVKAFFEWIFHPRFIKAMFSFFYLILNDLLFMVGAAFILTAVYRWSTNHRSYPDGCLFYVLCVPHIKESEMK